MQSMLYMSSPINALLEGFYRDDITIGALRQKGDFGIGTFNNLDGEMILLDGRFFQLDLDGNARSVSDDTLPKTLDYLTASFTRDARRDIEKAES
jgi:alpha-acetolactate decarboxylase